MKWWTKIVCGRTIHWNNGDDSPMGGLVLGMAVELQAKAKKQITEAQTKKFAEELMDQLNHMQRDFRLSVDYDPCPYLSAAFSRAGISYMAGPVKTHTWITDKEGDFIPMASLGYRGAWTEITAEGLADD